MTAQAALPKKVKIVEVSPRDGLQNEPMQIASPTKVKFIDLLSETGLSVIEATSFVSPGAIPQMQDADAVFAAIKQKKGVRYPVLVPNTQGLARAEALGAKSIAVFGSATETFSQRNINCSIAESLERFEAVVHEAKSNGMWVRAYISCVLGCPYEGEVKPEQVVPVAQAFMDMGVDELSLGDTIGVGTPLKMKALIEAVKAVCPIEKLAVHCHDTYGQALANIVAALEMGVSIVDSSVAGLGGCPYARGATGNVATEDVLYCLEGLGIETGVDLDLCIEAGQFMCEQLGVPNRSKTAVALLAKKHDES